MDDLPGSEALDLDDVTVMELAAAGAFDLAVAPDAAFLNEDFRFAAGGQDACPLEELVELDFCGINLDVFDIHDASFLCGRISEPCAPASRCR